MKIPTFIVAIAVGAVFSLQAWTLTEIVNLKIEVAAIKATLQTQNQIAKK